jgi:chromosome segregation ATPase
MQEQENIVPPAKPDEDVLDVLAEFESGLESLKALYSQRQRLQARIRQHEDEVKAREATLAQQAAELQRAAAEHEQRQKSLDENMARLAARESELEAAAKQLAEGKTSLEASRGRLDEETAARSKSLEAQAKKLAEESQAVEKLTRELESQARSLEQDRAGLAREQQSRSASLSEIESLRADAAAQRDKLAAQEAQSRELQQKVESLARDLAQARELADKHAAAAKEAAQQVVLAANKSGDQQTALKQQLADQAKALAAAAEQSKTTVAKLSELQKRAADFETHLAREREETARVTATLAQHQESAQKLQHTVDGLQAKIKSHLAEREDMRLKLEAAQAGLMQATARCTQLETALAKALAEVKSLQAAAEAKAKKPVTASNASMLRRRARLKTAHDLIRERSKKLAAASEAIKKRVEQCEQVMAQRQELAAIRDRVILAERSALRRQAGGRAMVMVLCAVCVFALLAGFAWAASRELAPATYLATSQLKADGRGRVLNPAELAEWTQFHAGLLEDPRFHETAADRFKKAGMMSLGSPSAVADLIKHEMTTQVINPGTLNVHLKGKGSNRTQLTLETFTAAFASHANAARQQRLDGSVTEVSMAAAAGVDPLDNTRTIYAVALLAGGVLLAGMLWAVLWKRLVGAKTAFESDGQVASALDDARWTSFAATGAAAQVAGAKARARME